MDSIYSIRWAMRIKHQGYVLFIVLVFMQLFALLGMYGYTATIQEMRLGNEQWRHQGTLLSVQAIMHQLEAQAVDCIIPVTPDIATKSQRWWQNHACSENAANFRYYYVWEKLGLDPCALIDNNQRLTADYYRLTLYVPAHFILMQSTVVKASNEMGVCLYEQHPVKFGRQMWRQLMIRKSHDSEFEG